MGTAQALQGQQRLSQQLLEQQYFQQRLSQRTLMPQRHQHSRQRYFWQTAAGCERQWEMRLAMAVPKASSQHKLRNQRLQENGMKVPTQKRTLQMS